MFTSGTASSILGAPVLSAAITGSSGTGGSGTSGLELIPQAASATSAASASSTTYGYDSGEISLGETLIATAHLLAPMMYVLSKKPELVEQLQELYQPNFLEEENIEEAETVSVRQQTKKGKAPKKATIEVVVTPEEEPEKEEETAPTSVDEDD